MGKLEKSFYWLFLSFILYIFIGFKFVPFLLKDKITSYLDEYLIPKSSIEKIEFNPFTFKIKIDNFKLFDENNISDIGVDTLIIDFSPIKYMEKGYLHFDNLTIDKLYLNIKEDKNGSFNISTFLKPTENQEKKETNESPNIEFLISKFEILNSNINFEKQKNKTPYKLNINNINYTIYDFGTYKNILSSNNLSFKINDKSDIKIAGAFRLTPFNMYGEIGINELKIRDLMEYKKELFNFKINNNANINFLSAFNLETKDGFNIKLNSKLIDLKNIDLKQNGLNIFSLKSLEIGKLFFDLSKKLINLENINIKNSKIKATQNKDGINFAKLIKQNKNIKKEKTTPWSIKLSNIALNGDFIFEDKTNNNNFILNNNSIKIKNITNKALNTNIDSIFVKIIDTKAIFTNSNQNINGKNLKININDVSIKDSDIKIKDISSKSDKVEFFDHKENIELQSLNNLLNFKNFKNDKSGLHLENFSIQKSSINIYDKQNEVKIDGDNINIEIGNIEDKESIFTIKKIDINQPNISIVLDKKVTKQTNLQKSTQEKQQKKETLRINIGPTSINDGVISFEDKNLPIPFLTKITQLNGNISHIKTSKTTLSTLNVDGVVNKYGIAQITGTLNPNNIKFLTDINMKFRNISMRNFTPYSGKFLGREFKKGKVDLDLKYNIDKSNLEATNKIVITKLELGDKIKSSEAISLPLDIAIALLKDSNGVINIEIPVLGNVDNPQFSVSDIFWKAFSNLIGKTVSAPFSVLGAMFNFKEEDIKTVKFELNESKITPIQKQTLDRIVKILAVKTEFAIKISPSFLEKKEKEKVAKNRVLNIQKYLFEEKSLNKNQLILDNEVKNSSSNIDLKLEKIK